MSKQTLPLRALLPRYWSHWMLAGSLWLLAQLPYRPAMRVGIAVGRTLYPFARRRRGIVERNIELCFPELDAEAREQRVRANFDYTGKAVAEIAYAWWAPRARLADLCEINGREHVEAALAQGRGVILLSSHFTCLEIIAPLVGKAIPTYGIYKPQSNPVNEYFMRSARERSLPGAIPRRDVRGILRVLKRNHPVWYAADQDYGRKHSVFAPFFGIPTATISAITRLAAISKAPVVPFFFHSKTDHSGYVATFHPAMEDFPGPDPVSDATRVNALIEAEIRRCPEQYLWAHRRFKTRPDRSEPSPYRKPK